ncbi:hypothetical protein BpHYR1_026925 [Brachionus plicatilis]|uniref:Uncharacterized protein n=1 Tax=Brachionus plicatilis TaxID=10195 RepID=A0A3M7T4Y6_BRAPC|nr:hypothetical protein BpHYR1_026925 [Brachionus plicatilis]
MGWFGSARIIKKISNKETIERTFEKYNQLNKDRKITLVFFGKPGVGKSRFINFLLSGNESLPLPSEPKLGKGVTKTPIRCEFINNRNFFVTFRKNCTWYMGQKKQKFHSFEEIREIFNSTKDKYDIGVQDEIFIQIPLEHKYLDILPDNVQLLDLIGCEDNENLMEKNKMAIKNSENVDSIFCLDRTRLMCDKNDIENMWKIGIFSDLFKKITPKIVMLQCQYDKSERLDTDPAEKKDCIDDIKLSLRKFFDFSPDTNSRSSKNGKDEQTIISSDRNENKNMLIMDKSKVIPEIEQKLDALILQVYKESQGYIFNTTSQDEFKRILEEIKFSHENHKKMLKYEFILMIISEIRQKLLSKNRHLKFKNESNVDLIDRFLKTETWRKKNRNIEERFENFFTDLEFNIINYDSTFDSDSDIIDISFMAEDIFRTFIDNLVNFLKTINEEKNDSIIKYLKKYSNFKDLKEEVSFNNFSDIYYQIMIKEIASDTEVELEKTIVEILLKNEPNCDTKLKINLENFKTKIKQRTMSDKNLQGNDICDEQNNIQQLVQKWIEISLSIKTRIDEKVKERYLATGNRLETIIQPYEPRLFNKKGSLCFPDELEIAHIPNLEYCIQKNWIKREKNEMLALDLFEEGKQKSQILDKGKQQFLAQDLDSELRELIKKYKIDTAVQFQINRNDKKIVVKYEINEINKRIVDLKKNIAADEKDISTHLYPIFISSRFDKLKKTENSESDFVPNIFVKDLCRTGTHIQSFMIFLFFEAGTAKNRSQFEAEIEYYTKLSLDNYSNAQIKPEKNPIILCLLPERNLGIGRIRKLMMLFAEHLNLPRFYVCDDDIDSFYQYDQAVYRRDMVKHELNAAKAFSFMSKVMDFSINGEDMDNESSENSTNDKKLRDKKIREIICLLGNAEEETCDEESMKILSNLNEIIDKDRLVLGKKKDIIRHYVNHLKLIRLPNIKNIEAKIELLLFKPREKIIGQIALWNMENFLGKNEILNRLQGIDKVTHKISKLRYQVVLYNTKAISGIHPVSDKAFFEEPLNEKERLCLVQKAKNKKLNDVNAKNSARLGYKYSDNAFIYYQILNGVTGYLVFYFAYKDYKNL